MNILVDLANLTYVAAYSVRDVLWLRIFAVLGGLLMIPFYYFQPTPLMVPIYWDIGFVALNMFWIVRLLFERRPVTFSDEEQRVYRLAFRTLTPRDMRELFKFAQWEDRQAGDLVEREGEKQDRLGVVVSGRCGFLKGGQDVGDAPPGQLLGMSSYLRDEPTPVSAVAREPVRLVYWEQNKLKKFMSKNSDLKASVELVMGMDLMLLLERTWAQEINEETNLVT